MCLQPSLAGLGLFLSFPGTCFAACRAIFIRAFRRSVHGQPWELFEPAMFGDVAKLCLYAESRFAPEVHRMTKGEEGFNAGINACSTQSRRDPSLHSG